MEHAIWLQKGGGEYISITNVKGMLGEDAARREKYICPSAKCGVKMITVFPKRVRRDAKEAHSDHFRACPDAHTEDCGGDGERKDVIDNQTGIETEANPRHRLVKRCDYPTVYVKRARVGRGKQSSTRGGAVKGPEQDEPLTGAVVGGIRKDRHVSGPETGHIRRIVEAYEDHLEERSQMELNLPECTARNYEDGFRRAEQAVDSEGIIAGAYIYYDTYHEHHISADNNTIIIFFSQHSGDGRTLSVRIEPELEPEATREEIKKLLARAAGTRTATVYAFGRFQPTDDGDYSIRIKAFGDLWITFPDETRA